MIYQDQRVFMRKNMTILFLMQIIGLSIVRHYLMESLKNLIVEGRTTDGEMILTVEAGNCKKEYDITNTEGEMVFDVSEFEPGLLKLYISHPKSEHIFVCIKWK